MGHESFAEKPPASLSRAGPIAVYVLGVIVGIGTMIGVGLFSYGGSDDLAVGLVVVACVVTWVMALVAARTWPERWWRWGVPAAVVCAAPILMFIPRIPYSLRDAAEGIAAWGGISAACFAAGLLGGWVGRRLQARRANLGVMD